MTRDPFLRPYVILDRDGTIIVEKNYLADPQQVELLGGTIEGLQHLSRLGVGLIIVTNQSGVGRGYFSQARLEEVHQRVRDLLAIHNVVLDGIYVCPHTPEDDCPCRKPRTGLLTTASTELGFDPSKGFVIGDKPCDIELGLAVKAKTFLVRTGYGAKHEAWASTKADYVVDTILEAGTKIAQLLGSSSDSGNLRP